MTMPLSPQEIQELVAGYVLGDLTSDEAEMIQMLFAEVPELQAEVIALQETLGMMPYGLEEVELDRGVRSHLLMNAQAELFSESPAEPIGLDPSNPDQPQSVQRQELDFKPRLPWIVSAIAASLAIMCGLVTVHLSSQIRFQQAQSESTTTEDGFMDSWSGVELILRDHQKSLANPDGPVDFVVGRPSDVLDLLHDFQPTEAALPLLPTYRGKLLGGSNCQFGKTQGLRLTYQLSTDHTVSAYQLDVSEDRMPELQASLITVEHPDGNSIVLWRDDNYLYALVAALPIAELQTLAHTISQDLRS